MIIFMYGEEDFLAKRKIKEFKDKFLKEVDQSGNSLSWLDASSATIGDVTKIVGSASLLAAKRMLVMENTFANQSKNFVDDILQYLEKNQDSENILVIYEPRIKTETKKGKIKYLKINSSGKDRELLKNEKSLFDFLLKQKFAFKEFKKLTTAGLADFIKQEFHSRGAEIDNRAVAALAGLVGSDLWQLDNEIDKLINYKKGLASKEQEGESKLLIAESEVLKLVKGNFDENIFALTDAISTRNKALANKLLEEQYAAGLADGYLLTMIIRQVKILLQIRQMLDSGLVGGQLAGALKIHPFVAQKGVMQARNFDLATLKRLLERLVEIDYKAKTGQVSVRTSLNILLSKV